MKIENCPPTGGLKINVGFTLIELLVVIAIIGILASLSLVSYGGAQKQSRDTKRKSDLAQYRNALEAYAGQNSGLYPGFKAASPLLIGAGNLCDDDFLNPFMSSTCLTDPNTTGSCSTGTGSGRVYCYFEAGSADGANVTDYKLYAGLETGGFWEVCSNGKAGKATTIANAVTCDL